MSIPKHLVLRAYHIFILVLSTGAFASFFIDPNDPASGSPVLSIAWLAIDVVALIRTIDNRRRLRQMFAGSRPLLSLVALCCVSIVWTVDASATGHAAFNLVMTTLIAADFALTYTLDQTVRLASGIIIVLVILGIPMDALLHIVPTYDFDTSGWHGVFMTKNDYGRIVVLCAALFLCIPYRSKILKVGFICATYLLLYRIHSVGAVVNCTLVLATLVACIPLRWSPKARTLTLIAMPIIVGALAYIGLTYRAVLTTSAGKDPSLTGRTELWRLAFKSIEQRPILGYGYAAFWGSKQVLAHRIREAINWPTAPHSHNGYIEVLLGIGAVGLLAVLATYYHLGVQSYRYAVQRTTDVPNWPPVLVIFFISYPFSEASLITGNTVFWLMIANLSFHLAKFHAESRVNSESPELRGQRTSYSLETVA